MSLTRAFLSHSFSGFSRGQKGQPGAWSFPHCFTCVTALCCPADPGPDSSLCTCTQGAKVPYLPHRPTDSSSPAAVGTPALTSYAMRRQQQTWHALRRRQQLRHPAMALWAAPPCVNTVVSTILPTSRTTGRRIDQDHRGRLCCQPCHISRTLYFHCACLDASPAGLCLPPVHRMKASRVGADSDSMSPTYSYGAAPKSVSLQQQQQHSPTKEGQQQQQQQLSHSQHQQQQLRNPLPPAGLSQPASPPLTQQQAQQHQPRNPHPASPPRTKPAFYLSADPPPSPHQRPVAPPPRPASPRGGNGGIGSSAGRAGGKFNLRGRLDPEEMALIQQRQEASAWEPPPMVAVAAAAAPVRLSASPRGDPRRAARGASRSELPTTAPAPVGGGGRHRASAAAAAADLDDGPRGMMRRSVSPTAAGGARRRGPVAASVSSSSAQANGPRPTSGNASLPSSARQPVRAPSPSTSVDFGSGRGQQPKQQQSNPQRSSSASRRNSRGLVPEPPPHLEVIGTAAAPHYFLPSAATTAARGATETEAGFAVLELRPAQARVEAETKDRHGAVHAYRPAGPGAAGAARGVAGLSQSSPPRNHAPAGDNPALVSEASELIRMLEGHQIPGTRVCACVSLCTIYDI